VSRGHGQPRAAPRGPVQALEPAARRTRAALRAREPPASCCTSTPRSSDASIASATASPATGATPSTGSAGRCVRGHRRPRRIGFTQMHPTSAGQRRGLPARAVTYYAGSRVRIERLLTDNGSGVPLGGLRTGLHRAGHRHKVHPRLPPADQRQGRTLHPERAARVGLRHRLRPLERAHRDAGQVAAPLQLAPPPCRHRRQAADVQTQVRVRQQRLDASRQQRLGRPRVEHRAALECERRGRPAPAPGRGCARR
jgi:hypothetical protein